MEFGFVASNQLRDGSTASCSSVLNNNKILLVGMYVLKNAPSRFVVYQKTTTKRMWQGEIAFKIIMNK